MQPVRKADNLTTILCRCHVTLTSWNPLGHSRPVTGLIYLYRLLVTVNCITSECQTEIIKKFFLGGGGGGGGQKLSRCVTTNLYRQYSDTIYTIRSHYGLCIVN